MSSCSTSLRPSAGGHAPLLLLLPGAVSGTETDPLPAVSVELASAAAAAAAAAAGGGGEAGNTAGGRAGSWAVCIIVVEMDVEVEMEVGVEVTAESCARQESCVGGPWPTGDGNDDEDAKLTEPTALGSWEMACCCG